MSVALMVSRRLVLVNPDNKLTTTKFTICYFVIAH